MTVSTVMIKEEMLHLEITNCRRTNNFYPGSLKTDLAGCLIEWTSGWMVLVEIMGDQVHEAPPPRCGNLGLDDTMHGPNSCHLIPHQRTKEQNSSALFSRWSKLLRDISSSMPFHTSF
jgi:hypothetical protein